MKKILVMLLLALFWQIYSDAIQAPLQDNHYETIIVQEDKAADSILKQLKDAAVIAAKVVIINKIIAYCVKKYVKIEPQFASIDNQFIAEAMVIAPLLEESLFTLLPRSFIGENAQYLMPILFGLCHYHEDPKSWAYYGTQVSILNGMNHKYLREHEKNYLVPIMAHFMYNSVAILQMAAQEYFARHSSEYFSGDTLKCFARGLFSSTFRN